ncbi:MAG: peptide chain release factor 2 [Clostridia bacterium]|nr:peptide chain release factor 2 [Clostridia bacterium]MBO4429203.1 peptide chain release factor 2 [Clostridia bacterium]
MIALEEARQRLLGIKESAKELESALKIEKLKETIRELEEKTFAPSFWDDQESSGRVLRELKKAKDTVEEYEKLCSSIDDAITIAEMGIEDGDESLIDEVLADEKRLGEQAENMRIETLLSGKYDRNDAILSLHPGAGGTEAQDWALMLYRMYTRWAEKHGFNVKLVDWLDGDEAGIKSATILVEGENAYGYLKSEHGVHRLVRISPFDASGRRHTSFASCEVTPEIEDDDSIELRDEDLEITAHRSSGAGGQHINKTDSAIRIVHKPTGIVVGCQTERSQLQNKETALKMLRSKLAEIKRRENLDRIDDIRGEKANIEWGSQIRSYVFMPYTLVKDTRTGYETGNIAAVMDGDIEGFINAFLKMKA